MKIVSSQQLRLLLLLFLWGTPSVALAVETTSTIPGNLVTDPEAYLRAPTKPPTTNPTTSPTDAPTDSPAPSPSPSEAPTEAPTGTDKPTGKPTGAPTESPAPSPSPSASPTERPSDSPSVSPTDGPTITPIPSDTPSDQPSDSPSDAPTDYPTMTPSVSQKPSTSPSDAPTNEPSGAPSEAPTATPSVSMKPSNTPSSAPTNAPTGTPSTSPTKSPTGSPTMTPTTLKPTFAPTTLEPTSVPTPNPTPAPTGAPSKAPSPSPTEFSYRTKTGITDVILVDLERVMRDDELATFEFTTLEFIRDTKLITRDYEVKIMAVTVLTQEVVYPERPVANTTSTNNSTRHRRAVSEVALQIAFRTVGVVINGTAPKDLDFTEITDQGFQHQYNQYLYRLVSAHAFFEPLLDSITLELEQEPSDKPEEEKKKKGQYVATILFSTVAFGVAVFAAFYAIRKHLNKQRPITDKSHMLEYPGYVDNDQYGTQSLSDTESQGGNQEQADGSNNKHDIKPLQLIIEEDKIELEDVGLSPANMTSPFRDVINKIPLSPSTMEAGGDNKRLPSYGRTPSFGLGDTGLTLKKWLTPRRNVRSTFVPTPVSMPGSNRSDPPDSEVMGFEPRTKGNRKSSSDPDALKAATTDKKGILSEEKETIGFNVTGNTPLGIPVNFFGRSSNAPSEATSATPMGSLAGSTASSFFLKMGKSVFTGRKSLQSEAALSVNTDNDHNYKFGATAGKSANQSNAYQARAEMSEVGSKWSNGAKKIELSEENLAILQTDSNPESGFEDKRPDNTRGATPLKTKGDTKSNSVSNSEKRTNKTSRYEYDEPDSPVEREPKRTRTFEVDSVISEQSELSLNEGIELSLKQGIAGPTLGARPVEPLPPTPLFDDKRYDEDSFVGHEYGSRPNAMRPPSTVGARNAISYNPASSNGASQNFTLGARPLGEKEQKQFKEKSSLESVTKRAGTYDLFAGSGPLGIVVDTSKEGPAVHSLKSTSPMLGLINAGDLIIALDDEDTRSMTAASLTRLMAKKSRQKERKITLYAPDGF